jgi:thiamine biosynthesis lipoprotein
MNTNLKNILKTGPLAGTGPHARAGRFVFVGVGNNMCSDDGVGPYVVSILKEKQKSKEPDGRFTFIDVGQMPENYIGAVAALKPDTVVIIDALDFKDTPGAVQIVDAANIRGACISTHGMPLDLFAGQIMRLTAAKVFVVGIQPQSVALAGGLTKSVKAKADELVDAITKTVFSFIMLFALAISGCSRDYGPVKQAQFLMGTTVEISVRDTGLDKAAKDSAIQKAFARMKQIEDAMSAYKTDSEVSRINSTAYKKPVQVSGDTMNVMKKADQINRITHGAFDITVAPLVELWGFGPGTAALKMPQAAQINGALKSVGMDKLKLDYAKGTVGFSDEGVKIDLGGIAAGYAVDCAIQVLKENGIKNAMINAGGDIFCMGKGPQGRPWKVGIRHPRRPDGLLGVLALEDKAVATSGDYQKYFMYGKKRVSHIIDPRSGTAKDMPASVTIVAPDCITADALSTAVFVLGPKKGLEVLDKMDSVEAMIVVDKGKAFRVYETEGFQKR